jgi:hypothetical protein
MDVIARCAFGMTIDNLGEKDDPFMTKAKVVFNPPANKSPLIMIPCNNRNILISFFFNETDTFIGIFV